MEITNFSSICFSSQSTGWPDWTSEYYSSDMITVQQIFCKWSMQLLKSMMIPWWKLFSRVRNFFFRLQVSIYPIVVMMCFTMSKSELIGSGTYMQLYAGKLFSPFSNASLHNEFAKCKFSSGYLPLAKTFEWTVMKNPFLQANNPYERIKSDSFQVVEVTTNFWEWD